MGQINRGSYRDFTVAEHATSDHPRSTSQSYEQKQPDMRDMGSNEDPLAEFYAQAHKEAEEASEVRFV